MNNNQWEAILQAEFKQEYFQSLASFIHQEYENQTIYPPKQLVFNCFYQTDVSDVKVVIIGQDPYHEPNQAQGLCFSVNSGVKLPPSLVNIYKEISQEYGYPMTNNGSLLPWCKQGVLLMNTVLTVRKGQAFSHRNQGWETFTDHILAYLNSLSQPIVFLLWGKAAQSKEKYLNNPNHLVLKAAHPSPLSAYQGFFGCNHFKLANQFLHEKGIKEIDWRIQ